MLVVILQEMSYQKMSVRDLVLEIGTEEIPSGYFDHIHDILSSKSDSPIKGLFESKNISVGSISSYSITHFFQYKD